MDAAGNRIKELRTAHGWSQLELSTRVSVSVRTIGTWEATGRVPLESRAKLTEALGEDPFGSDSGTRVEPSEINYRGWRLSFTPAPGASPEQVRQAEAAVLDTALAKLRELGLDVGD